jgi:hypothetical protein
MSASVSVRSGSAVDMCLRYDDMGFAGPDADRLGGSGELCRASCTRLDHGADRHGGRVILAVCTASPPRVGMLKMPDR